MGGGWWGQASAKRQFLRRLYARVGHPLPLTFEDPFVFHAQGDGWTNIDQLEAVVEFYWNFPDPWKPGAAPLSPGDSLYRTVSLRPPAGSAAAIVPGQAGPTIRLDDGVDLSWVLPSPPATPWTDSTGNVVQGASRATTGYLYDTLWLEADSARASRLYRIMTVDHQTVTLDAAPAFPAGTTTSKWKINRRPILVLIDSFGARERGGTRLSGAAAAVSRHDGSGNAILTLDVPAQPAGANPVYLPARVSPRFDTIYLPRDSRGGRSFPFRTYRILATTLDTTVSPPRFTVTVDGDPSLDGGSSPWHIPAGVSGDCVHTSDYNLAAANWGFGGARAGRGYDHYDGAMFVVYDGKVYHDARIQAPFRWTSYTSRDYGSWSAAGWQEELSSIQGNKPYFFQSYRSPKAFINYTFSVVEINPTSNGVTYNTADHIDTARFYFGTPQAGTDALDPHIAPDSNGKGSIRIHRGNRSGSQSVPCSGSAGCQVSTESGDLRSALIRLYQKEYRAFHGGGADAFLAQIANCSTAACESHWNTQANPWPGLAPVSSAEWNDKLAGVFWVIRPDELPSAPPAYP